MTETLRIPNEPRFVRAFARAVDPGDTLSLLLEVSALDNQDMAIVRRTREALEAAYEEAAEAKDWEQVHCVQVLRQALAEPDSAAYLAYMTTTRRGCQQAARTADDYAEALAVVGCAADTLGSPHCRPWEIEPNDISLPDWRRQVWNLLFAMPEEALPQPSEPPAPDRADGESGGQKALPGDEAGQCEANDPERRNAS